MEEKEKEEEEEGEEEERDIEEHGLVGRKRRRGRIGCVDVCSRNGVVGGEG